MRTLPIGFSPVMANACWYGRKTETRRVLNAKVPADARYTGVHFARNDPGSFFFNSPSGSFKVRAKYLEDDRLWVREAYRVTCIKDGLKPSEIPPRSVTTFYEAGGEMSGITPYEGDRPASEYLWSHRTDMPDWAGKARPGMFMMPWQSRMTLIVTGARVERLQDITREAAIAEGIVEDDGSEGAGIFYLPGSSKMYGVNAPKGRLPINNHPDPRLVYRDLINNLHGGDLWSENPWVTVTAFEVRKVNFERVPK